MSDRQYDRMKLSGLYWVLETELLNLQQEASSRIAALERELAEAKAEIKRLHDKYDFQLIVKERDALKAEVERLKDYERVVTGAVNVVEKIIEET